MGVMECERKGCSHILCDRMITIPGDQDNERAYLYICSSCFEDLLSFKNTWGSDTTVEEVREKVRTFMKAETGSNNLSSDAEEEFDSLFRRC